MAGRQRFHLSLILLSSLLISGMLQAKHSGRFDSFLRSWPIRERGRGASLPPELGSMEASTPPEVELGESRQPHVKLAVLPLPSAASVIPKRIAILCALPPLIPSAVADQVRIILKKDGYPVTLLTGEQIADARQFNRSRYDLLIIPHADTFPAVAQPNLLTYLRARGRLLCLGGPPFSRYVYQGAAGWKTRDAWITDLAAGGRIVDLSPGAVKQWTHSSNNVSSTAALSSETGPHGLALRLDLPDFSNWDYFTPPPFTSSPFLQHSDLLLFWAKGDSSTRSLVVEWRERDGSRWMGAVPLTTTWKRYGMTPSDFHYWPDNPSKGRGGPHDQFRPSNAAALSLGLASAADPILPGPHHLWIADLAFAHSPGQAARVDPPVLEALSPSYKLQNRQPGRWAPILRYQGATPVRPPGRLRILTWSGDRPLEWMYRPYAGSYAGAAWGACSQPGIRLQALPNLVREVFSTCYVTHTGPSAACFWQGEPVKFVARVVNQGPAPIHIRLLLQIWHDTNPTPTPTHNLILNPILNRTPTPILNPSPLALVSTISPYIERTLQLRWPGSLPPGAYRFSLLFTDSRGAPIDTLSNRFTVLTAKPRPEAVVTTHAGQFMLNGKPWRPVGVNYWPLWISGQDPNENWREWLLPDRYDPDLIERELTLARRLNLNALSVLYLQTAEARPLNDFLARCRVHHIHANVFLGAANPLASDTRILTSLITTARLASNDAVFAYDLAWEPRVGSHDDRKRLDPEWEQWVLDNYGSILKAERDWSMAAPREAGRLTSPLDAQLMQDGPWRRWVASYRRFMDDRISRGYREVRRAIRKVDPWHLLGARSGYGGNGSLFAEGVMAFDLRAGAKYLDFISPEGYALSGSWKTFRDGGGFTTAYARWAGNGKPVFWAEFGQSVYPETPEKLASQSEYFRQISRMVIDSDSNGEAGWWWPGGLRLDENSDYGIIAPDGAPRPAAISLEQYARQISQPRLPPSGKRVEIQFDRDQDARGCAGVWMTARDRYGSARDQHLFPVLRTEGTGTTSATMPLAAVGNVPADGANPLKYCNADFNDIKVEAVGPKGIRLFVSAGNTGEASWTPRGAGRAALVVSSGSQVLKVVPLPAPVSRFGDITFPSFIVPGGPGTSLALRLAVLGRSIPWLPFGEKVVIAPTQGASGPAK